VEISPSRAASERIGQRGIEIVDFDLDQVPLCGLFSRNRLGVREASDHPAAFR